ncbi:MAG: hypothetical protein EOS52_07220 [Mesorhizobium sp.]|uniref:hypothetical protein n=1 Tax=Mesorhizobium sp. TaxID=1871066 RepID=UPI000FE6D544|nr:hypothetical protein [Mesorhizobium sp.]RWC15935.1 MAG: hypothetical protein EOS52_07220 [Mesorhizobium sp.]
MAAPALTFVDPHERFRAALAELKAAAEALDPRIYDWTTKSNGHLNSALTIAAWRTTTVYEGDGWYAAHYGGVDDDRMLVERAPEHDRNGERWFRLTSWYKGRKASAYTPESCFVRDLGRKIGNV